MCFSKLLGFGINGVAFVSELVGVTHEGLDRVKIRVHQKGLFLREDPVLHRSELPVDDLGVKISYFLLFNFEPVLQIILVVLFVLLRMQFILRREFLNKLYDKRSLVYFFLQHFENKIRELLGIQARQRTRLLELD